MYIFYYEQFTLSVHTNLSVTDHFGSTIKTNELEGHTKDYYPRTHAQGHDISIINHILPSTIRAQ